MKLPTFLTDLLTSRDGVSFDPIRVGMILGGLGILGFTGWDVVQNHTHFNAVEFGTGLAAIFAGGGIGIGAKAKDEPDA